MPLKLKDKSAPPMDAILYREKTHVLRRAASSKSILQIMRLYGNASRERLLDRSHKHPPGVSRDQPRPPADKIARVA